MSATPLRTVHSMQPSPPSITITTSSGPERQRTFWTHLAHEFDYRADDVWLSSYPRSGTTWTYEVLSAILYEGDIAALQHAQRAGKS